MAGHRTGKDQYAWLDERAAEPDVDGDYLRAVRAAARGPETELIEAVKRARERGWSWTPIALVLGTSRGNVVSRFSRGIGHPAASRLPRQRDRDSA